VAHIWPFTTNDNQERHENTRLCMARPTLSLDPRLRGNLEYLFTLGGEVGSSDRSWNMLTMNPRAHRYWANAYFGLQWHDVVGTKSILDDTSGQETNYTTFRVQWHWLPAKILESFQAQLALPQGTTLEPKRLVRLQGVHLSFQASLNSPHLP
jgi:hypothetical protein